MSDAMNLKSEIQAVCRAAGFDPETTTTLRITPNSIDGHSLVALGEALDQVKALCQEAGYDPGSVAGIEVGHDVIRFEIYMEPKQNGAHGPLTTFAFHPLVWK